MSDASFASLGPTLLARKGGAKPAMRPQVAPFPAAVDLDAGQLEDLGWNDMGENVDTPSQDLAQTPANDELERAQPHVRKQQESLAKRIAREADEAPAQSVKKAKTSKKLPRRAAFTLRLDPDRHLKLRLAATMRGLSAQALMTEALDHMLGRIDDIEALAARMKRN